MTKLVAVLALAVTISGRTSEPPQVAAPSRPHYSGSWSLIEDRGAPSGPRALGNNIKIDQSPTVVTIERAVATSRATMGPKGLLTTTPSEILVSTAYTCDGAEHELPFLFPKTDPSTLPPHYQVSVSLPPTTIYRATWTTDQLIIVAYSKTSQGSNIGAIRGVSRLALSLDADGSLIVDSLTVPMIPRSNGPKEEPPVSVRSAYKKAQ